jgi:hypothetical protein
MDADTDVSVVVDVRLGGVQPHPHADRSFRQRSLSVDRRRDGVARALERDEEPVARGVDLVAVVPGEGVAQELPVLAAHASEVRAERAREISRSLDVREQERHRSLRQAHAAIVADRQTSVRRRLPFPRSTDQQLTGT